MSFGFGWPYLFDSHNILQSAAEIRSFDICILIIIFECLCNLYFKHFYTGNFLKDYIILKSALKEKHLTQKHE